MEFAQWILKQTGKTASRVGILNSQQANPYAVYKIWERDIPKVFNVVYKETYPQSQQDFSGIVANIKKLGVDLLFQCAFPVDAILLTRAFKEQDYNPLGFIANNSGHDPLDYIYATKKDSEYYLVTGTYSNDLKVPMIDELRQKMKNRYGQDYETDHSDMLMANAVSVLVDALERAGTDNPAKLRDALKATNLNVGQYWYVVPDGCKFDETGQNIKQKIVTFQIRDGKHRAVYPAEFASIKPVFPIPKWSER